MLDEGLEKAVVLRAWKERWSDDHWMEVLIETRYAADTNNLSNAVLDLLTVGEKPNQQLLHYLDLAIACQALPICSFIRATHNRIKGESLHTINSIVTTLVNHMSNLRDETDPDDPAKLPSAIMTLVEWLVYIQVNAIKQLTFGMEEQCLSLFRGCSKIMTIISEDTLLKSLAPLWGGSRWQTLTSAMQNIQIPLDACSDEGKKTLASSLVTFVRSLERIHVTSPAPAPNKHLFILPCKMLLYHDILYRGQCSKEYFSRVAQHYGCSLQRVCMEWGKAHLQVIIENKSCRELVLAMLMYKYPRMLSELFPNVKQSEAIIVSLFQQDLTWSTVCLNGDWNITLAFLQVVLQWNLLTKETFEQLTEGKSAEQTHYSVVNSLTNAERMLRDITELFNSTNYTHATSKQIIALLESVSCNNSFTEQFDKMFFVAAAKGELGLLISRICSVIDSTCDGASTDHLEEQNRFAVFDICCLILVRCCMMFGSDVVPHSAAFCRWLGSHVCGPHNPLHPVMPLIHPGHPSNHQDNVNMLVQFFSSDCRLNTASLQNVITAFPDALKDIMIGIKSEVIIEDKFYQQTAKLRDYMLIPVFVAIHWLIHYIVTVEDDLKHMTKTLMKPFLKHMSAYTPTVLLKQRVEILQKSLNSTVSLQDLKIKKNLIKKPFWVNAVDRTTKLDSVWSEVRSDPTLENISNLFTSDNIPDIVYSAATETLNLPLSGDIKHAIFTSAIFLQADPRYVPWLLQHTIPELINDGLPSHWKSYIWALSQVAFLSLDLYMINMPPSSGAERTAKRQCRSRELEPLDRGALLREALAVFWGEMKDVTREEGYSYGTTFLHRFIKYGIDLDKGRLRDVISEVDQDVIKSISTHLIDHELVSEGVTLLQLSGADQNQCAAILQSVL